MSDNDLALLAHLMRRAGFGATREELEAYAAKDYAAVVEDLDRSVIDACVDKLTDEPIRRGIPVSIDLDMIVGRFEPRRGLVEIPARYIRPLLQDVAGGARPEDLVAAGLPDAVVPWLGRAGDKDLGPLVLSLAFAQPGEEYLRRNLLPLFASEDPGRRLVTFDDPPINKPHGLNVGLREASGDVVTIFDAEDEPHPDILNVVNTVMVREGAEVVQCGVQLMNYDDRWFSALRELARERGLEHLSIGTSQDYVVAAEEGATIVRIGTKLYT